MTVTTALTLPAGTGSGEESDADSEPPTVSTSLLPVETTLPGRLDAWLAAHEAELVKLRRHIHAHPELSGQEFATAELVAATLRTAGLKPRMMAKGNGVLCDIGTGDRAVALRADLDALPLSDTKKVPYKSTVDNVCHACGHDVHTTILVGVGRMLAELEAAGELPGRVRLIFQPTEEQFPSGAPEVIAEGGLKDVESIFALHCYPQLPAGYVAVRSGPITAAADKIDIRLSGPGGHTARPHLTVDLAYALSRIVVEVPALLSRRLDPRAAASLVFGAVRAGEAHNAIANEGYARGTVRVLNPDAWRMLPDIVPQLVRDVVAGTGAVADIEYTRGVPPVINDRVATAVVAGAAAAALGPDRVAEAEISMGGEDFAFYLEQVPGTMFRLGVGKPGAPSTMDIHQSTFDIDEKAIGYGVRVFVHTALAALSSGTI
jgi:amidohydrolase